MATSIAIRDYIISFFPAFRTLFLPRVPSWQAITPVALASASVREYSQHIVTTRRAKRMEWHDEFLPNAGDTGYFTFFSLPQGDVTLTFICCTLLPELFYRHDKRDRIKICFPHCTRSYFSQGILLSKGSKPYNNINPENCRQYPLSTQFNTLNRK